MVLDEPHGTKADNEFAQNVRHAGIRVAPANVGDPLSIYGCVDHRRAPKQRRYGRMLAAYGAQGIVPHEAHADARERREGAIQDREVHSMEIRNVSRNKERRDLPFTLASQFRGSNQTLQDHK